MKRELILIPKIKIHPTKIITYNEAHWIPGPPVREKKEFGNTSLVQVEENGKIVLKRLKNSFLNSTRQGNGKLSAQAKKRLELAMDYFLVLNKPNNGKSGNVGRHYNKKITFLTLTLPSKQIHTDNEIKAKCLNQFMIEIAKYHKVSTYIWRAEYQKNGNIHFHILANKFIWWNDIRNRWNRIINKLGYVDRYRSKLKEYHREGFKLREDLLKEWPEAKQRQAYKEALKTDFHNPNSIDIHSIQNITNVKAYLKKYLTKDDREYYRKKTVLQLLELLKDAKHPQKSYIIEVLKEKAPEMTFEEDTEEPKGIGRSWGASVIISNIKGAVTEVDSVIEKHLKNIENHFPELIFKSDYFSVIDISIEKLDALRCKELTALFRQYLLDCFNFNSQLSF